MPKEQYAVLVSQEVKDNTEPNVIATYKQQWLSGIDESRFGTSEATAKKLQIGAWGNSLLIDLAKTIEIDGKSFYSARLDLKSVTFPAFRPKANGQYGPELRKLETNIITPEGGLELLCNVMAN